MRNMASFSTDTQGFMLAWTWPRLAAVMLPLLLLLTLSLADGRTVVPLSGADIVRTGRVSLPVVGTSDVVTLALSRVHPINNGQATIIGADGVETPLSMSHFVYLVGWDNTTQHRGILVVNTLNGHVHGSLHLADGQTSLSLGTDPISGHHVVRRNLRNWPPTGPHCNQSGAQVPLTNKRQQHRQRRASYVPGQNFCHMALEADFRFYQQAAGSQPELAVNLMIEALLYANTVLASADFPAVSGIIQLQLDRVKVYTTDTDPYTSGQPLLMTADELLDRVSQNHWEDYCLGHLFTCWDFADGVVGKAWIGKSNNSGGICERGVEGMYRNSGFTSFVNFGKLQPPAVTSTIFAHEVGHNFGAEHDSNVPPLNSQGYYIMAAQTVDGSQPNNRKFSPGRSVPAMNALVESKGGCFQSQTATCGNGVQEKDEACDCGSAQQCTLALTTFDQCCQHGCGLASGTLCTPRKSSDALGRPSLDALCCSASCIYQANSYMCRPATGCRLASRCDGQGTCVPGQTMAAHTLCSAQTSSCSAGECAGVCDKQGECSRSVCSLWMGYMEVPAPVYGQETSCKVYCMKDHQTLTTAQLPTPSWLPTNAALLQHPMRKPAGTLCIIDLEKAVFGKCTPAGQCLIASSNGSDDPFSSNDIVTLWLNAKLWGLFRWIWISLGLVLIFFVLYVALLVSRRYCLASTGHVDRQLNERRAVQGRVPTRSPLGEMEMVMHGNNGLAPPSLLKDKSIILAWSEDRPAVRARTRVLPSTPPGMPAAKLMTEEDSEADGGGTAV